MIIDEPHSVLGVDKGNKTRKGLARFKPLFNTLYSATHRKDEIYITDVPTGCYRCL